MPCASPDEPAKLRRHNPVLPGKFPSSNLVLYRDCGSVCRWWRMRFARHRLKSAAEKVMRNVATYVEKAGRFGGLQQPYWEFKGSIEGPSVYLLIRSRNATLSAEYVPTGPLLQVPIETH
ncbi:hypothetical protein TWF730_003926 [Orbilia blumenaviensis]|uniref:Uncharacterized protein n=1 Tax=Orbilia blumenaviensis TaxID=1796055 RepID=A0AAV9U1K0_9PEZI